MLVNKKVITEYLAALEKELDSKECVRTLLGDVSPKNGYEICSIHLLSGDEMIVDVTFLERSLHEHRQPVNGDVVSYIIERLGSRIQIMTCEEKLLCSNCHVYNIEC